jgi:hypothetical protein
MYSDVSGELSQSELGAVLLLGIASAFAQRQKSLLSTFKKCGRTIDKAFFVNIDPKLATTKDEGNKGRGYGGRVNDVATSVLTLIKGFGLLLLLLVPAANDDGDQLMTLWKDTCG